MQQWLLLFWTPPRDTQAIFHFMGPLNLSSTRFLFEKSGSACLNISNVLQKGKNMFIFSYFCPCLYLHILEIKIFDTWFCFNWSQIAFICLTLQRKDEKTRLFLQMCQLHVHNAKSPGKRLSFKRHKLGDYVLPPAAWTLLLCLLRILTVSSKYCRGNRLIRPWDIFPVLIVTSASWSQLTAAGVVLTCCSPPA